ncbi:MAG: PaaI family thioesterase [Solirubrobacteraceae bacterium]
MSKRTRTITWEDPVAAAESARAMDGMQRLKNYAAGSVPASPFALTIDTEITGFAEGSAEITFHPAEFHYDITGFVAAGVLAAVLDSVMGVALQSQLPAGAGFVTLEISVNTIRPVSAPCGDIKAEGTVLHLGRRIAYSEARAVDGEGQICASATSSLLVMHP